MPKLKFFRKRNTNDYPFYGFKFIELSIEISQAQNIKQSNKNMKLYPIV